MTSRGRGAGFTLLELLIAVAIFSLLATACYRLFKSVSRTHEVSSALWEQNGDIQRALLILNKDFAQLIPRPIRNEFGDKEASLVAASNGNVVMSKAGWRNFTGEKRSNLQRVGYRVDGGRLIRRYWNTMDRAPDTPYVEQVVLDNVQGFVLRFRDEKKRWQNSWPPSSDKQSERLLMLPSAVEYTIEHQRLGKVQQLVVGPGFVFKEQEAKPPAPGPQSGPQSGPDGRPAPPSGDETSSGDATIYPGGAGG
ncbi:type II secretion system minor pseudopilin GspJ [Parendozoicomonas haliclonae]|uniref:Type II secretion system protein J n=1 Tax=Parendozoicomonas haliclonae TaxID=1960125 RepID=A0A1X7AMR8_9GAMM|nr:type II secretion system minor pseudopilin GspJ [Parendozoicomonas haliclonae]SMA49292.1 Type II secretion system protein J precursor [Parendozoicomonas haliclonae]